MKIKPEYIVAGTALGLLLTSLLCQLAAKHWQVPILQTGSKWLFIGGIVTAFLPLILLLIVLGWEKATHSRPERMN
jgi:hypothetical protein